MHANFSVVACVSEAVAIGFFKNLDTGTQRPNVLVNPNAVWLNLTVSAAFATGNEHQAESKTTISEQSSKDLKNVYKEDSGKSTLLGTSILIIMQPMKINTPVLQLITSNDKFETSNTVVSLAARTTSWLRVLQIKIRLSKCQIHHRRV